MIMYANMCKSRTNRFLPLIYIDILRFGDCSLISNDNVRKLWTFSLFFLWSRTHFQRPYILYLQGLRDSVYCAGRLERTHHCEIGFEKAKWQLKASKKAQEDIILSICWRTCIGFGMLRVDRSNGIWNKPRKRKINKYIKWQSSWFLFHTVDWLRKRFDANICSGSTFQICSDLHFVHWQIVCNRVKFTFSIRLLHL